MNVVYKTTLLFYTDSEWGCRLMTSTLSVSSKKANIFPSYNNRTTAIHHNNTVAVTWPASTCLWLVFNSSWWISSFPSVGKYPIKICSLSGGSRTRYQALAGVMEVCRTLPGSVVGGGVPASHSPRLVRPQVTPGIINVEATLSYQEKMSIFSMSQGQGIKNDN